MNGRFATLTGCIAQTLMIIILVLASVGTSLETEQGEWQRPSIDSVEVSLINSTGFFNLAFTATGSAPAGTETVNVTFGTINGTELQLMDNTWFTEGGLMILGNGVTLEAEGDTADPWSEWTFKVRITLPYNGDPLSMIDAVKGMLPVGIDNSTLDDLEFDPENITRTLAEMEFFFVARAYNETGSWGQEAYDITAHVQTAVLQFFIDEGFLDDPNMDDDDTSADDDVNDGKKEVSQGVLIAMGLGAIILLIAAVIIAIFLLTTRSRKL